MIIASDLDRTLIYSQRAIDQLGHATGMGLKPVEKKDGKYVSYMTELSLCLLEEICRHSLFVPVTTRTEEQFNRITIFHKIVAVPYVITSNGANILFKGEKIHGWSEHIASRMRRETAPLKEVVSFFHKEVFSSETVIKQVEDLFFYFIFNRTPVCLDKQAIAKAASSFGWSVSLQGRKLYFIPKPINKGDALSYICDREGINAAAGAGDSVLDWEFLARCKFRFVPRDGELASELNETDAILTKNRGVLAGEEILQQFLSLLAIKN
ncbi:hypothetical protein ACF5W4_10760 [Bacillota bacterium Lsc_1132]